MTSTLSSTSPLSPSLTASSTLHSSSSSPPSSSTSGHVSISSAFDSRFLKSLQEDKERNLHLGIGFRSGPFKHLIPLRDDADGEEGKKKRKVVHRINTREEPEQEEDDEEEQDEDEARASTAKVSSSSETSAEDSVVANTPSPAPVEPPSASSPAATAVSEHPAHASSPLLDLAQSSAAASPALVKEDSESALGQQIIDLITRALRMQGEMLTEYAAHVLLADESSASASASKEDDEKPLSSFASRFRSELQQSHDELKSVQTQLQSRAEEEGDSSMSLESLLAPVLGPLSATFLSLIPSSLASAPAFAPLASSLASSLSSSTAQLAASLLAAKRGRGRLQKCEKHRRWKKRCPADCPDKPVNKFIADGDDDGEEDEDDDEDGVNVRVKKDAVAKRRMGGDEHGRGAEGGDERKVKQATIVQSAVPTPLFQSVVPLTPAVVPQQVEAVRAYEPTIATSVLPSVSLAMTSPTSVQQQQQQLRQTVVVGRSHAGVVQHGASPSAVQSIPLTPAPTTTTTLYTAQPIVLPSSHQPAQLYAYSTNPASYAPSSFHPSSTTIVTLDQLAALQSGQQQPQTSYRLIQQQPHNGNAYPLRAAATGQPVSVIYQAARPQPGYHFTNQAQGFHMQ